jgi:Ca-activated chloride channel family protein|nr:von Willebrand factor type A domain-containing protein [Candidatus Krumholzibacteria bacterium]
MKRYLKNDKHQLSMHEQEEIWRGIQARTGRGTEPGRRRRSFAFPVFGLTSLTAMVLLFAVWFHQQDAPDKIAQQVRHEHLEQSVPPVIMEEKPAGTLDDAVLPMGKVKGAPRQVETEAPEVETAPPAVASENTEKFAIETVEKALQKQAGVPHREGEVQVRGGRSGEVTEDVEIADTLLDLSSVIISRRAPESLGSVTGGTTPPNGAVAELMYHEHTGVNPFVATEEDALSTFAVDVDNASYTMVRSYLNHGELPPADAVRVEEFVNFFSAGYPEQTRDVFAIHTDGSESRFGAGYHLLRVGLKGMDLDDTGRKPANLIFVIDISGSMSREDRLELVKKSLHILLNELQEGDKVGIVTYGNSGRILLEPTDVSRKDDIRQAIDRLGPSGGTNACEGLEVAYILARRHYDAALVNRLILCSDGVANLGGATRAEEMLAQVRRSSDEGITLSTVGFGMGNYNDVLMEKLANQGDGNYHYVDQLEEAERVFKQNLTGLLQTIAREVKIQVEFNPDLVKRWRLLGYENRDVADRDFRNDNVDAGEVGVGHEVTALYELKLAESQAPSQVDLDWEEAELGTVRVRYEYPAHDTERAGQVKEIARPFLREDVQRPFSRADSHYRLQAVAAEFAEILRHSFWARESRLSDLVPVVDGLVDDFPNDSETGNKARELAAMIRQAVDLQAAREAREKSGTPRD